MSDIRLLDLNRFGPVGRCIYCLRDDVSLSTEHIIPHSLDGTLQLLEASCTDCAKITGAIEGYVTGTMLGSWRSRWRFPSRKRTTKGPVMPLDLRGPGDARRVVDIAKEDHPTAAPLVFFRRPNMLERRPDAEEFEARVDFIFAPGLKAADWGAERTHQQSNVNVSIFARMLAKIAHGYAVWALGVDGFDPFLPDIILNAGRRPLWYVGGNYAVIPAARHDDGNLHLYKLTDITLKVGDLPEERLIVANVRLFANLHTMLNNDPDSGTPEYEIVVGRSNAITARRPLEGPFYPPAPRRSRGKSLSDPR